MAYKIQKLSQNGISCIISHTNEDLAKREVKSWLEPIIAKVEHESNDLSAMGFHRYPDFLEDVESTVFHVNGALQMDDIWRAYETWRRFVDKWDGKFQLPLWVRWGDIRVEQGLGTQRGPALGALDRWVIRRADFVSPKDPFVTMSEATARQHTEHVLRSWIMENLRHQVKMWADIGPRQHNEHAEFVQEGRELLKEMKADLDAKRVWTAYTRWKLFEEEFEGEFPPFGLVGATGSILVEPTPEPE